MFIDCHTHTNFNSYKEDSKEVVQKALDEGVWMIQVGSQWDTSERAVKLAEKFEQGVFACVGLHPSHLFEMEIVEEEVPFVTRAEEWDAQRYEKLAKSSQKVVAIGECGLEYHWLKEGSEAEQIAKQKEAFAEQIELAKKLDLPLMVHCRGSKSEPDRAYEDALAILQEANVERALMHCFIGSQDVAKKFLDLGYYISFGGIVTFKNAPENQELAKFVPLDRMLSETDAPYLAPHPLRGSRNEPVNVKLVVQKLAELKSVAPQEAEDQLFKNAQKLFRLP